MYDLAILGGGPGGVAAGVYASRKQLKTVFITEEIGGQSVVSLDIQNWIGTVALSGQELADNLKKHLETYAGEGVDMKVGARVSAVAKSEGGFRITTSDGKTYDAKTVLITTGASRRKLDVPGADTFDQKGLTYCASCDGPLFSGLDVAIIGAGNAGFESAAQLLAYTKSVTLITHSDTFRADPITVKKVLEHPNLKVIKKVEPIEVKGTTTVTGLVVRNLDTKETTELPVQGIFVEIGMIPSTDYVVGLVDLDPYKRVVTNPKNQRTSVEGIWAAGDCTDELYHQNNIAAGDGVKALEDIYMFLKAR